VDKHAKAEARQNTMAEAGRPEKRPGKDASPNADRAQREASGPRAKASKVGSTVADGRRADDKHPQKRAAADNAERQGKTASKTAKAKGHVADRQDASDKNDKKL
jgi:hypothetical protein